MKRILIANRGEIAVRIIRAARDLGIETVAVYSDPDAGAVHVRLADHRVRLEGSQARETYLHQEKLLQAAKISGADSVHPGYGFLAENAAFTRRVLDAGLTFIGPSPEVMKLMGDKAEGRRAAEKHGVPVIPGTKEGLSLEELRREAAKIGYPVLAKAVAGGSGRGMRLIQSEEELEGKVREAQTEAKNAFSDDAIILEKFLTRPRHIEVQVFGDGKGSVIEFGERECSVQRRHQKIIEEAPAWNLHPRLAQNIRDAAVRLAQAVSYQNSGTVEFLVDGGTEENSPFYFVEMNTRIQVEHPVTEVVWGVDLVKLQIEVARGGSLPTPRKTEQHAIEFRIYAENPALGFKPATGKVLYLSRAGGPGVREDGWAESGTVISPYYDSLLAKLIVSGADRAQAIQRAKRALMEYHVDGLPSTLPFHRWCLEHPDFAAGAIDVYWIDRTYKGESPAGKFVGPAELPESV